MDMLAPIGGNADNDRQAEPKKNYHLPLGNSRRILAITALTWRRGAQCRRPNVSSKPTSAMSSSLKLSCRKPSRALKVSPTSNFFGSPPLNGASVKSSWFGKFARDLGVHSGCQFQIASAAAQDRDGSHMQRLHPPATFPPGQLPMSAKYISNQRYINAWGAGCSDREFPDRRSSTRCAETLDRCGANA